MIMKRPLVITVIFISTLALVLAGFFLLDWNVTKPLPVAGQENTLIDLNTEFVRIDWTEDGREAFFSVSENSENSQLYSREPLPLIKVDSVETLKTLLKTAETVGGAGQFAAKCSDMDEEFFEKYTLFVSYISEGSGSVTHSASASMWTGEDCELRFDFIRHEPEIGTCDMAAYLSYTVIENSLIKGCDKYSAFMKSEKEVTLNGESVSSQVNTMESSSQYYYCGNTITKIKSIAGGISSGSNYVTIDAEFWGDDSVWITDTLRKLDYSGQMCKCMAEYSVETEFGNYSVNLSQKYARNEKGQSDLDTKTVEKLKTIIIKYGSTAISEPVAVRVKHREDDSFITLSPGDCATVSKLLSIPDWDDGIPDCVYDYIVQVGKRTYYYHLSCGTFIDAKKSLPLSESEKETVNAILAKYLSFDGAIPVSSAK